jgi:hypothetical protein
MSQQYTKAEVAQHKDEKSMFIIVDDGVYDIAGMLFIFRFLIPPSTPSTTHPQTQHTTRAAATAAAAVVNTFVCVTSRPKLLN